VLILADVCVMVLTASANASEFCVTCSNPDASYACTVDNEVGAAGEAALKLFCITEIAKAGGHASCTVNKAKVAPCEGQKHALKVQAGLDLIPGAAEAPAVGEGPAANSGAHPPSPASPAAHAPAADGKGQATTTTVPKTSPPATVEEAVKDGAKATEEGFEKSGAAVSDAAKSAGSAIEKAGSAVGDAAKKSWHCLKSLFSDC